MTFKRLTSVTLILGLALTLSSAGQQSAEQLYKSGLYEEEVGGDLQKAIAIYQDIVKRSPERREIAARALLRIGLCYEKLGLKQATEAFQTIVEKYPDQTETVSLAREKLAVLMKTGSLAVKSDQGLKISLVWQGEGMDVTGEISPDGKYLSCVDWTTSDLAVRDIATEKLRRLTSKEGSPPGSYEAPDASIWSPDSREIAYTWYGARPEFCELRLFSLNGSKPRILYRADSIKDWVSPCDWSPDGRHILAKFYKRGEMNELGLISVQGGSIQYLKAVRGMDLGLVKFSPDGRSLIYDHPQKSNPECRDISLLPLEGENAVLVIEHPVDDWLLGWSPDGRSVLFSSNRTGTWDAWTVPIVEGKAQGVPRLVKRNLGKVKPMGMTQGGSLYYSTPGLKADICSVSIDPDSGRLLEEPKRILLPYEGNNTDPRLSPDGKHLAYISQREPGTRNDVLGVYSFESGEAREVRPRGDLWGFNMRGWMPDGLSILIYGRSDKERGFFRVELQTGETTLLLRESDFLPTDQKGYPQRGNFRNFSLDGRSVFYSYQGPDKFQRVMTRHLDTKDEKEIRRFPIYDPSGNNTLRLSPDGLRLALLLREEENVRSIKVFPATGGEVLEVCRFEHEGRWSLATEWSPDGRFIYFLKRVNQKEDGGPYELWRVPSSGGNAQRLGVMANRVGYLNIHPDGKHIIFQSSPASVQGGAVWVMENFLPSDKAKK